MATVDGIPDLEEWSMLHPSVPVYPHPWCQMIPAGLQLNWKLSREEWLKPKTANGTGLGAAILPSPGNNTNFLRDVLCSGKCACPSTESYKSISGCCFMLWTVTACCHSSPREWQKEGSSAAAQEASPVQDLCDLQARFVTRPGIVENAIWECLP